MLLLSTRLFLIASTYLVEGYFQKVKITAPVIAEKCNINSRALMPALRRLTQVGILKSQVGGREPGFIFARDPALVSMYEIIVALEGEFSVPSCRDLVDDINCEITDCDSCLLFKIMNSGLLNIISDLQKTSIVDHNTGTSHEKCDLY